MTVAQPTARSVHLDGLALAELVSSLLVMGTSVRFTVRGGSMSPWIRDGDLLTILPRGLGQAPLRGDIVAFRRPGGEQLVVHRLVRQAPGGWIARGDRCDAPDGFIADAAILGTVDRVTCRGWRRPLPQGLAGLLLSTASRLALQARDRIRPARPPERASARVDRA